MARPTKLPRCFECTTRRARKGNYFCTDRCADIWSNKQLIAWQWCQLCLKYFKNRCNSCHQMTSSTDWLED